MVEHKPPETCNKITKVRILFLHTHVLTLAPQRSPGLNLGSAQLTQPSLNLPEFNDQPDPHGRDPFVFLDLKA